MDNVDFMSFIDKMTVSNIDKCLADIKKEFDRLVALNEKLRKENNNLKDEAYKDNELRDMKDKLDSMREDYFRGFPISETEEYAINNWKVNHKSKNRKKHCGSIYTYEFIPTELGVSGVIRCNCGAEFEFQELG